MDFLKSVDFTRIMGYSGMVKIDKSTIEAIEAIIARGNDAEVRRKGHGYVVLEVKKTIKVQKTPM